MQVRRSAWRLCRAAKAERLGGCQNVSDVLGVPLELQLFWRPGSLVGLGLYGFANFNSQRSFGGLTLGLQLGRLR